MASIRKQKSGRWRAQVRRKGREISETFLRFEDARAWAVEAERQIDRKDPRQKTGNNQSIPLLKISGFDPVAIIEAQRPIRSDGEERIFPYHHKSAGTAFTRACRALKIVDLHFHDLRHEGTSRLFEAGFQIPQVALVTGHKDWKMLRRYTHLKPESLHAFADRMAS